MSTKFLCYLRMTCPLFLSYRPLSSAVQSQSYFWNFWPCFVLVSAIIQYYLLDWTQVVSINSVFFAPATLNFGILRGQC